ncbi:MAG: RNA 2',3'-cyclic phosphodiesterase [Candidatus Omnitrophota bacterium]
MRAFIAIKLPLDIQTALVKIQDKLKTALPKINWVAPANLHLSLKFLGEISLEQLKDTQQIIAEIIKTTHSFQIRLETLGVFPNCRLARIIWIGTPQAPIPLKQLVEQLEKKLLPLKIPKEQHIFQTHITLGRLKYAIIPSVLEKELSGLKDKINDMNLKFYAGGITLFQSVLGPGGPTYSILKEADF